ncbi:hypothetical protein H4R21_001102, partial [Coemansia helicoidea]
MSKGKMPEEATSAASGSRTVAAGTSAAASGGTTQFADTPMAGVYAPFSLDGSDINPGQSNVAALQYLPTFESEISKFT